MTEKQLCDAAVAAMKNSYSPYSEFCVGAALLCKNGTVYTGCNIENAAFSPTVCAERVAIFKAISEGERQFSMIAVAGGTKGTIADGATPCGVCRQVFGEFCSPDFVVLVVNDEGYSRYTLNELLPFSFGVENMNV